MGLFLNQEQKDFYEEQGFILLDNVFSEEEIETCSQEYDRLFQTKIQEKANLEATWKGQWRNGNDEGTGSAQETSLLSIHNLQCHSAVFTRMLLNENLVNAVADVIESPNILLHHTKAHVKPPENGSPFPTHQDYHYFPFKNDSLVAVFIHLDDSDPENGGLAVFPGSHKLGPQQNCSNVPTHYYVDQEKFPVEAGQPVIAKRGQVLIFSYLLIHGSFPNESTRNRRMLLFQMMSADDVPLRGVHMSPGHGLVLRGTNVHQNADIDKRHIQLEK